MRAGVVGWVLVACAAVFAVDALRSDVAADEPDMTVAKALLDSANGQLRKKNYDAALSLIEKTLAEAPTYLAALELKGVVLEKLGRTAEAAAAYQAWVDAYDGHSAAGTLGKGDTRKKKVIDKRLEKLTQGVRDLRRIETALRADLGAFVKRWQDKAPSAAERAAGILEAMDSLGATEEEPPAEAGVMSRVYRKLAPKSEVDLIARKSLGTPDGMAYPDDGGMRLTYTDGGTILQPVEKIAAGEAYVYELQFQPNPKSNRWLTGLVFGIEGSLRQFFAAFVKNGKLILHRVADGGGVKEDVAVQRAGVGPGKLHALTVVVRELSIEVYIDGKKKISYTAPRLHDLSGGVGIWAQDAVIDAPALRLGRIDK